MKPKILASWDLFRGSDLDVLQGIINFCREGLLDGVEVKVSPRLLVPNFESILEAISEGLKSLFIKIHVGTVEDGVDLGQRRNDYSTYLVYGRTSGLSWKKWNGRAINDAFLVAERFHAEFPIVLEPGYRNHPGDREAGTNSWETLREYCSGKHFALEVLPALHIRNEVLFLSGIDKPKPAIGGTPGEMKALLQSLGPDWKCFLNLSHILTSWSQAMFLNRRFCPGLDEMNDLEQAIAAFQPCSKDCHFSGISPGISGRHPGFPKEPPGDAIYPVIKKALQKMEVIVLEINFKKKSAREEIERFRELYL